VFLDLIEAAIHTGRRAKAAAHVAAARDGRLDRLSPRLRLIVLAGEAITAPGDGTSPQAALEQAITEPGHDRWPFDPARIQLTHGSHLRRLKHTTDARRHLAAAAETFRRLGATPWTARADRELRATGITVGTADTGPASLTPQQFTSCHDNCPTRERRSAGARSEGSRSPLSAWPARRDLVLPHCAPQTRLSGGTAQACRGHLHTISTADALAFQTGRLP
jgi:hypothetical protein